MNSKPPVFIVGVPRSGTTLLAAMLAAHRNMSCGPETHFFRWINRVDELELTKVENWPETAINFISSIVRRSFTDDNPRPLIEKYRITKDEIQNYLSHKPPSIAAMLSSITEIHMEHTGKNRWVEKTPDHIKYLHEIRKLFPQARIIRIVRDPRDIALSLSKVPWGVQSFLEGLIYWNSLDATAKEFFKSDPFVYTLKFEDLIQSTEVVLSELCNFLEEPFDEHMLNTSDTGKELNSRNVPWKEKASQPIDHNRIMVWKKEISQTQNYLAEAYLGDRLDHYGYPRAVSFSHYGYIFPSDHFIQKYEMELSNIAQKGIRFWQNDHNEVPDTLILLGDPAEDAWANGYKASIFPNKIALISKILQYKLAGREILWVGSKKQQEWTGLSSQIIKVLLSSSRVKLNLG